MGVMNLLQNVEASGTRKFMEEVDPEDLHRPYGLCLLLAFLRLVEGSASIGLAKSKNKQYADGKSSPFGRCWKRQHSIF